MSYGLKATSSSGLNKEEIEKVISDQINPSQFEGLNVLVVVPDHTRTAPVGKVFKSLFHHIGHVTRSMDVIVALGTHPPMTESAIQERLDLSNEEREGKFSSVRFINHQWDNPDALQLIGTIPSGEIRDLTDGRFEMDVPVEINKIVMDYDHIIIIGPVFPHEVVGFSGGNKYFFPGIAGPRILNFFHWLGAVVTNAQIIGRQKTPVRKVVDAAGAMIQKNKTCLALVVGDSKELAGLYSGTPESAWELASEHSRAAHIIYKEKSFDTVLSVAPPMYEELWTAGKAMYKLEPVVADGGELIIYAPHLSEISETHGEIIKKIGYHVRDYFLKQWDDFKDMPWGVIAHSTHVKGSGTYQNGIETPRIKVTVASQLPESICKQINLGYRDPASICFDDYKDKEDQGILFVPKAGERLFLLQE